MEQVLLSANINNLGDCVALATAHGLGIEVMAFAFPHILDGDWQQTLRDYQEALRPIEGALSLHGPFMDMAPGSTDPQINAVCMRRYKHAIQIADQLNARKIVFHANFIAAIHNLSYRQGWHRRNVEFWGELAPFAERYDVTVTIENMWEFDPSIITDILAEVNHPYLRGCLDVGHAHLFGDDYSFPTWLEHFKPFLTHVHMNNTHGKLDTHNALGNGTINYDVVLNQLRELPTMPTMVLEMYEINDMRDSLPFFHLSSIGMED